MEKGKAMELSTLGLKDRAQWEAKGYQLPQFDRAAVTEATRENPCWIHFGARKYFPCISGKCNAEYLKQRGNGNRPDRSGRF